MSTPYPFWPTRHEQPAEVRRAMIDLLNRQLADALDLGLQAKQAHWNVKGPHFAALHALFDQVAETVEDAADELAERTVELGGIAHGTLQAVTGATRLPPYPPLALDGLEHVRLLGTALAALAASTRAAVDTATTAGDAATADALTEVLRAVDKQLWQVEAHAVGGAFSP